MSLFKFEKKSFAFSKGRQLDRVGFCGHIQEF